MNSAPGKGPCAGRKALPHTTAGLRHSLWLDQHRRFQNRALFDVAIDSKLYGCDVVKVRIGDIVTGSSVRDRAVLVGRKPNDPCNLKSSSKPAKPRPLARASRRHVKRLHLPRPQRSYGTPSLRRTMASIIYKLTRNLRGMQIFLGHAKESTGHYLGVDVEDALGL